MESIDILTGQNVIIRYQSANLLQRAGARLLDYFFIFAILFSLYYFFEGIILDRYPRREINVILMILVYLSAIGYHFIFESILGGKTPGKMIVKIKVTNIDGSIPGIGAYFMRWLLSLVDLILWGGVGALFIILSRNKQRLGDMAAGTIVVKTNPSLSFDLDESYYVFSDDYEPTFTNVDILTDGQIAFITNLLIESKNQNTVNDSIIELAYKVKSILQVESNLKLRTFLETVVKDYNYYATLEI